MAMLSLRQLQAFEAIVQTGNFSAAAALLGTTQPAISKRIAELEAALGVSLFDRDRRGPHLTRQGHAARPLCAEILRMCRHLSQSLDDVTAYAGTLRLGITELVALTFLPALVTGLRARLPQMQLRVEVKMAEELFDDVLNDRLDAAISPGAPPASLHRKRVARVDIAWMCAGTREDIPPLLPVAALAEYPLLAQTQRSGLQALANEWLVGHGVRPNLSLSCNSLAALCGLTVAGLGLSLLPRAYFQPHIAAGTLKVLETTPPIGPLEYHVVHAETGLRPVVDIVAEEVILAARNSPEWG
jgi:DNA-binding transcriptional LysR family regulator